MWVTKLLISPVKIKIFCPKKSKFCPKMAFLFILGHALPAHLVGGHGARAVSRKTPIYFIYIFLKPVDVPVRISPKRQLFLAAIEIVASYCF